DLSHMEQTDFEVVILTGGASRRMGVDKSSLIVDGARLIEKLIRELTPLGCPITVLGRKPESGVKFLADAAEFSGPLASLRAFHPSQDFVFVLSCDVVRFCGNIVAKFRDSMLSSDAAIPFLNGFDQPLCALYSASAFSVLRANPDLVRVKDWTSHLSVRRLGEDDLMAIGIHPLATQGANTIEEFQRLIAAEF
ncbi:MAG: NTP transferase domain-containing protein, partial [Armatimonadota bacterium]